MTTNKNTIKGYPRRIESRISETKFQELLTLLSKSQNQTMSSLIRDILSKRKVTITTYDRSLDFVLEELSQIHQQINAIGVNVNQLTRFFHQTGDLSKKIALIKKVEQSLHQVIESQENLKETVQPLLEKWLQK